MTRKAFHMQTIVRAAFGGFSIFAVDWAGDLNQRNRSSSITSLAVMAKLANPDIVSLGYTCPCCQSRVVVFCSSEPQLDCTTNIFAECQCGYINCIYIEEIQSLEVWRETKAA